MMNEQTITKLIELKLVGLAEAYREQQQTPDVLAMSFEERFARLVEYQYLAKQNQDLERRLKYAALKLPACIENINWQHRRGLDREMITRLAMPDWVRYHQNCIITGPTGVGKSYLACALAQKACRNGYRVLYLKAPKLFRDLLTARASGSLTKLLKKYNRVQLLLIDDLGLEVTEKLLYRDFLEMIEDRVQQGAVIITSQYPIKTWHEIIGDQTVADAIIDRLVNNSYLIKLKGESMRKIVGINPDGK